jgi:transposase
MQKYSLGIDMGFKTFHACLSLIEDDQQVKVKASTSFSNNAQGFKLLIDWINKHYKQKELPLLIVMEATGVYYERCALTLFLAGYKVSVVLPNIAKKYLGSIGQKSKNDKIDAKGLSRMGAERKLDEWQPMQDFFYTLRSYTRQHESLQQTKTILNNQKHAVENQAHPNALVLNQLQQLVDAIEGQIKELFKAINQHIASNKEVSDKVEGICQIKGVGVLTASVILAETNGFALFKNIPQLVSYSGYDVVENQSGKHVGKTKISKHGNGHIRRALYMPALHAAHWEQSTFEDLYQRIIDRTKIKMKAYVAVQKKLLTTIFSLWKNNTKFDKYYKNKHQQNNQTEEQEQMSSSLVSLEKAGEPAKKVVPKKSELHKVNKAIKQSQHVPSLVMQN